MLDNVKQLVVNLIGDPHLGRVFKTGVPLHRQGEREASVWVDFETALERKADVTVILGDLFDRFVVPPEVVLRAVEGCKRSASRHRDRWFVLLRGNHDASRDADKKSSFDLFCQLMADVPNFIIARDVPETLSTGGVNLAFVPWHPFINARDMVQGLLQEQYDAVFGHWEVEAFGHNDDDVLPIDLLSPITPVVYTGHIHQPSVKKVGKTRIVIVGSLQPYSHAEDVKGDLYVTLPLEQARELAESGELRDKNVRVLLNPGEMLDVEIDCLALTTKNADSNNSSDETVEVNFDEFDFAQLFRDTFARFNVSAATTAMVWDRYQEEKKA